MRYLKILGLLVGWAALLSSFPAFSSVDVINVDEQPEKGTLYPVGSSFVSGQSDGKKFVSVTNDIEESLKATQNPNHLPPSGKREFVYGRGVGTIPTHCPAGWSDVAGLCAKNCPAGFNSVAGVCWQQCPTNFTDHGLTCTWWKWFPETIVKQSWVQERRLRECAAGQENDAGLCYQQCAPGYNGVGPLCWGSAADFAASQQRVQDQAQSQQDQHSQNKPAAGVHLSDGQSPVLKTDLAFTPVVCALDSTEGAFGLPVPGIPDLVATGIGAGVGAIKPAAWFNSSLSETVVLSFEGGATCEDDGVVATASLNFHPSITVQASTKMFDPALHNLAGVDIGVAQVSVYELIPFRVYGAVGTTLGVDTTISSTIDRTEPGFFVEGHQYATSSLLEVESLADFWLSLEAYLRVTSIVSFIPDLVQLGAEFKLFVLELDLPYVLEEGIRTVNGATELFKNESLSLELEAGRGYIDTFLRVLGITVDVFPEGSDLHWNGHQETHTLFDNKTSQQVELSAPTQQKAPEYRALVNSKTGLCMDVSGGRNVNGTNVQQWSCNGSDAQLWRYETETGFLKNKMGRCLDNRGQAHNGGEIVIWDCVNSNNLRFDWVGTSLRNRHNNNIAVDAYGTGSGANIGQWSYHGGSNQQWQWGS